MSMTKHLAECVGSAYIKCFQQSLEIALLLHTCHTVEILPQKREVYDDWLFDLPLQITYADDTWYMHFFDSHY